MARSGLVWDDKRLAAKLRSSPARLDLAMTAIMSRAKPRAERYMKTNAPWQDRTGNARQGLHAAVQRERLRLYALILAHTVEYGIWLEIAHGGRLRIVGPTVKSQGDAIMRDVSQIFAAVFG